MTADKFEIATDPGRKLLRIVMRGHWSVNTVATYKEALVDAVSKMRAAGCHQGDICALVDARELSAQSQDAVARYKNEMGGDELAPRRLATLVSSALFKRQVERIAISNQQMFTDEAEALAWLISTADED